MRYERHAENFLGMLYLGCCIILLRFCEMSSKLFLRIFEQSGCLDCCILSVWPGEGSRRSALGLVHSCFGAAIRTCVERSREEMLAICLTNQMHLLAFFYRTCEGQDNKRISDSVVLQLSATHHIAYVLPLSFQAAYRDHHPC